MEREYQLDIHEVKHASLKGAALSCGKYVLKPQRNPDGTISTDAFLSFLEMKYSMPDLTKSMFDSYLRILNEEPLGPTFSLLNRFIPSNINNEIYDQINFDLGNNISHLRVLLKEELAKEGLSMKVIRKKIENGDYISPRIKFAISSIQEYGWFLTLFNYKFIYKVVKNSPSWNQSISNKERQDFFTCNLLAAWELACKHDPKRGKFTSFLGKYLKHTVDNSYYDFIEIPSGTEIQYSYLYKKAYKLLSEKKFKNEEELLYMISLLYDKTKGILDYPEGKELEALEEYMSLSDKKVLCSDTELLKWKRGHSFRSPIIEKRIKRIANMFCVKNPYFFDEEKAISVRNPDTGNIEEIEVSPIEYIHLECDSVEDEYDKTELRELMQKSLNILKDKERFVMYHRYFLNETQGEIAKKLNVTSTRISQIEQRALRRLRHPKTQRFYRDFLVK